MPKLSSQKIKPSPRLQPYIGFIGLVFTYLSLGLLFYLSRESFLNSINLLFARAVIGLVFITSLVHITNNFQGKKKLLARIALVGLLLAYTGVWLALPGTNWDPPRYQPMDYRVVPNNENRAPFAKPELENSSFYMLVPRYEHIRYGNADLFLYLVDYISNTPFTFIVPFFFSLPTLEIFEWLQFNNKSFYQNSFIEMVLFFSLPLGLISYMTLITLGILSTKRFKKAVLILLLIIHLGVFVFNTYNQYSRTRRSYCIFEEIPGSQRLKEVCPTYWQVFTGKQNLRLKDYSTPRGAINE